MSQTIDQLIARAERDQAEEGARCRHPNYSMRFNYLCTVVRALYSIRDRGYYEILGLGPDGMSAEEYFVLGDYGLKGDCGIYSKRWTLEK